MGRKAAEGLARVEEELVAERAAALRRIGERLEELLARLRDLARPAPGETWGARAARLAEYRAVHREAQRYRWYLEIQRESIGLRRHDRLDETYPIPDWTSG